MKIALTYPTNNFICLVQNAKNTPFQGIIAFAASTSNTSLLSGLECVVQGHYNCYGSIVSS